MKRITIQTVKNQGDFPLILLEREEWGQLGDVFPEDRDFLTKLEDWGIHPPPAQEKKPYDEYLGIRPQVIRLSPRIHYVIYRDLDRQGNPFPIYFFFAEKEFVLMDYHFLSIEKVLEWARRGVISHPLDLARVMGIRLLHHHQEQLELLEDQMEVLEEEILSKPVITQQKNIIRLQRQILGLKKSLNRHLEVFTRVSTIGQELAPWQELITHTQRGLENVRQTHELVESLREAYQAAMDNRANEIMKFLTLLATIFLPINVLTGFFGMNFEYMPLINNPSGIYIFGGISLSILLITFYYFHTKDWLR